MTESLAAVDSSNEKIIRYIIVAICKRTIECKKRVIQSSAAEAKKTEGNVNVMTWFGFPLNLLYIYSPLG